MYSLTKANMYVYCIFFILVQFFNQYRNLVNHFSRAKIIADYHLIFVIVCLYIFNMSIRDYSTKVKKY